ncbi:MAG TPA: sugar phosphate isomerase/epimerase [Terriglobales bacterium]|nr:sugar phosphate isomerase/epimerase [Terriglobales bacterium]
MDNRSSRRDFFKRALAGAAALAATPAAGRPFGREGEARPAPRVPFALGLASYTCREFGLDETLAMARRVGLARLSLKDVHLPLTAGDAEIAAAVAKVRGVGIVPYGCGVVYMKTPAEVERAFAYAGAGGMEVIVGVPDHALLPLAERKVRETGLKLAIHNHGPGDPLYPTPASVLERVKGLDARLGLCLDIGHSLRAGVEPSEAAEACGARLLDVHLKDVTAASAEGGPVEAGRGVLDLPRFLRTLAKLGYRGTASFEYEKDGKDPLAGLAESVGYVRGVLAVL